MASTVDIASSFIQGAPPGELQEVVKDINTLTSDDDPALIAKLKPAFERYNEEQLVTVKLPGSNDYVRRHWHSQTVPAIDPMTSGTVTPLYYTRRLHIIELFQREFNQLG